MSFHGARYVRAVKLSRGAGLRRSGHPGLTRPARLSIRLPWYVDLIKLARERGMRSRSFCPTWTPSASSAPQWLHTCDERAIRSSFEGFHTDDIHSDLPRLEIPARLIVAGRGDVIRNEDVEEIRSLVSGIKVARVDNAGHMIPWDDEQGFYAAFADFLGARLDLEASKSKEMAYVSKRS